MILLCLLASPPGWSAEQMRVAYLNPTHEGDMFWGRVVGFMRAVADDLEIDLRVYYNDSANRFGEKEIAQKVLSGEDKPDYFITQIKRNTLVSLLKMTSDNNIRYFTINTGVSEEDKEKVGSPRGKFPNWIGQMVPDDYQAGYELAEFLIVRAGSTGIIGEDKSSGLLALSGGRDSTAALQRNKGLMDALNRYQNVQLKQLLFTEWGLEASYELAGKLFRRHPDISVIWAASDGIALGVARAANESGLQINKDVITGGIDWSLEGIDAVKNGTLSVSLGGHFMEAGWALVLLHDYHHGIDFAPDTGVVIKTEFIPLTQENLPVYEKMLTPATLSRIDFKRFSKVHNPALKKYRFGLDALTFREDTQRQR